MTWLTTAQQCTCDPVQQFNQHYWQFFGTWFSTCLYTKSDLLGFFLGLFNLCLLSVLQFPQIHLNYKLKDTSALAIGTLLFANLGDITGTMGLLLTGVRGTMLFQQVYSMLIDLTLTSQWIYYTYFHIKTSHQGPINTNTDGAQTGCDDSGPQNDDIKMLSVQKTTRQSSTAPPLSPLGKYQQIMVITLSILSILMAPQAVTATFPRSHFTPTNTMFSALSTPLCDEINTVSPALLKIGSILSYISSIVYIVSCFPQIRKHYINKRVDDGYSRKTLVLAMLSFTIYQFAIYIPSRNALLYNNFTSKSFFTDVFPFSLALFCTLLAYSTILFQTYWYKEDSSSQTEPLLPIN